MFIFDVCATLRERKSKQCLIDPLECFASQYIKKLLQTFLMVSEIQDDPPPQKKVTLLFFGSENSRIK